MKSTATKQRGPLQTFTYTDGAHTPSSKTPGAVSAVGILEASFHQRAGWLSIHADEIVPHGKGERTNRVWIDMPENHARALAAFLQARYGQEAALIAALDAAERFIAGFEGDELQEGIDALLTTVRTALGKEA